jgi:hypothetical protein
MEKTYLGESIVGPVLSIQLIYEDVARSVYVVGPNH